MRSIVLSALALACLMPALAEPEAPSLKAKTLSGVETNAYRHGGTYRTVYDVDAPACQQACNEDGACLAWSHVEGGPEYAPSCELKRSFGKREKNPRAISGTSQTHALFADQMNGPDGLLGGDGAPAPDTEVDLGPEPLIRGRD